MCNKKKFLLDKKNNLKLNFLINYIKKNKKKEFIIFGFTSSVWLNLIQELKKKKIKLPKNHGIMIHGGGWKKMFKLMITTIFFAIKFGLLVLRLKEKPFTLFLTSSCIPPCCDAKTILLANIASIITIPKPSNSFL